MWEFLLPQALDYSAGEFLDLISGLPPSALQHEFYFERSMLRTKNLIDDIFFVSLLVDQLDSAGALCVVVVVAIFLSAFSCHSIALTAQHAKSAVFLDWNILYSLDDYLSIDRAEERFVVQSSA